LIDRIKSFLIQSIRERTDFNETVKQLTAITQFWNDLLGTQSR
jgi:flagellar biosynthesis/type III secretory pathway ATPase